VAAPGELPCFAQPRGRFAPQSFESRGIGPAPASREKPASTVVDRGELVDHLHMTPHDRRPFAWTELARPMGDEASDDQAIRQEATLILPEAAHKQNPDRCSEPGASTSRAGSGSALRAKLAEFTCNRPKG
jgi:hypothetical protein